MKLNLCMCAALLSVVLLVLVFLDASQMEMFTSRQEKANAIAAWFNSTNKPTYQKFKRDLGEYVDIVDYDYAVSKRKPIAADDIINII